MGQEKSGRAIAATSKRRVTAPRVELKKIIGGRIIAFHRYFVDLTGSITAALMLSQALYWSNRTTDGWFYKSRREWNEETGLSRREQEIARACLRRLGFWQEKARRWEHKMFYRVDFDALVRALGLATPEFIGTTPEVSPKGGKRPSDERRKRALGRRAETSPRST